MLAGLISSWTPSWSSVIRSSSASSAGAGRWRPVVERVHEADVELGAVAADQVHLGRQAGQRRQVAQRAAGDHGGGGLVQAGERAQRADRLGHRAGLLRVRRTIGASVPS